MFESHRHRYTLTAIALHWLLALGLIGTFAMGLYMSDLPLSPQRLRLYNWHKWAGACILALTLLRLGWRLKYPPPPLPQAVMLAMPDWQRVAMHATHHLLYLMCLVVPLVGWAYSSASGFPVVVFGVLPLPDFVSKDKALAELIEPWHVATAWVLMTLVLLHVAAVVKHVVFERDGLFRRMWP